MVLVLLGVKKHTEIVFRLLWNSLELKNIAWIYSCIITDISLMYTALDFYLWRGSIWVFILTIVTIMDKTSSLPPQQKLQPGRTIYQCRHYWRQNQTEDGGVWWLIGLVWMVVAVTGDEGADPCSVLEVACRNIQEPPVTKGQRDRQIVERWILWRDDWRTMQDWLALVLLQSVTTWCSPAGHPAVLWLPDWQPGTTDYIFIYNYITNIYVSLLI